MATMADVARLAGVAASTVSRVLTGTAKISEDTRQRVFDAIAELDYRPDVVARSLAKKESDVIGFVIPRHMASFPGFSDMIEACESAMSLQNKQLFICQALNEKDSHIHAIHTLMDMGCDGLLFFNNFFFEKNNLTSDDLSRLIDELPVPMVVINAVLPKHPLNYVRVDHKSVARIATDYAVSLGHTEIAYISGPLWQEVARWRLDGYQSCFQKNDLEFNALLVVEGNRELEGGYQACLKLLERNNKFTAVCCFNDATAIGVTKAFSAYNIPEEEMPLVVGIDNLPILDFMTPKISSVQIPMAELGAYASELLLMHLGRLSKDALPSRSLIGELVIR